MIHIIRIAHTTKYLLNKNYQSRINPITYVSKYLSMSISLPQLVTKNQELNSGVYFHVVVAIEK